MKKTLLVALTLLATMVGVAQVQIDDVVLPRKTEIFIELERALSSKTTSVGERFHGKVQVPVTLNDQIVVPAGAFILGQVDTTEKPGYFKGTGEVELSFDTIILPDGTTRKLMAVSQSAEGHSMGGGLDEGKIQANSEQADEVINTAVIGGVLGGAAGGTGDGVEGFGLGSALGAATGAIVGLVFRGKHVTLPRGTSLTIQLEHDTRFAPPVAMPSGKLLKP